MGLFGKGSGALFGGLSILAGLFSLATGIGGGLGARLILAGGLSILTGLRTQTGRSGFESSPRYGFDNLQNRTADGAAIPVIYGKEVIAPSYISLNLKGEGDKEILHAVALIGEGEIDSVSDVRLNDTPIDSFPDAVWEFRAGTPDQDPVPGFEEVGTPYDARTELTLNTTHTHETNKALDALDLRLVFPSGLHRQRSEGDIEGLSAFVKVEYKEPGQPDSAYQLLADAPKQGETASKPYGEGWTYNAVNWLVHARTTSAYRRTLRVVFPTKAKYVIRVTGQQNNSPGWVRVSTLEGLTEIEQDVKTYAGKALITLRVPATGQLSGGTPKLTSLVKGRKVYDPRTGETVWSRNPVLCARDLLLNPTYGLGQWIVASDLDEGVGGTWRTEADACDDLLTGTGIVGSHRRNELDLVMDTKSAVRDWLSQILATCRLTLFQSGGMLKLTRDEEKGPVRVFSEDEGDGQRKNILAEDTDGSFLSTLAETHLPASQQFSMVRVRYSDRDDDYKQRTVSIYETRLAVGAITGAFQSGEEVWNADKSARGWVVKTATGADGYVHIIQDERFLPEGGWGTGVVITGQTSLATAATTAAQMETLSPQRPLEIQLFGVTRSEQALREARYHLNKAQITPRVATFRAFHGDADVEPGDVIAIDSDRLGWVGALFMVESAAIDQQGFVQISARQFDPAVYKDTLQPAVEPGTFPGPGGSITPGTRAPAGGEDWSTIKPAAAAGSSADEDAVSGKPLPKQKTPGGGKPKQPPAAAPQKSTIQNKTSGGKATNLLSRRIRPGEVI